MVDSILRVTVIPGRLPASPDRSGDRGRPDPPGCRGGAGRTADDHYQVDQATDRDVFHAREGHPPGPNGPLSGPWTTLGSGPDPGTVPASR